MNRSLALTLMLALAIPAVAQETTTTAATTATAEATTTAEAGESVTPADAADAADAAENRLNSAQIRERFGNVLGEHPPELATILKLDPSLLANNAFLASYPQLEEFVRKYPEVQRNPRYYLALFRMPGDDGSLLDDIFEMIALGALWIVLIFGFAWLVRTVIEQRRWTRLSRIQTEAHNKILDRFGTSQEVLEYIQTPAGTRFLESAPIQVRAEETKQATPFSRVMLSIQLGVVVAVGAIGMVLVSFRFTGETGQGLFAIGMIAFFVGAGFIASALVSLFLSKRLGLWRGGETSAPIEGSELVR